MIAIDNARIYITESEFQIAIEKQRAAQYFDKDTQAEHESIMYDHFGKTHIITIIEINIQLIYKTIGFIHKN